MKIYGGLFGTLLVCYQFVIGSATVPQESTTTSTTVVDVLSHRNVGLINPEFCGPMYEDQIVRGTKTGLFEMPWMVLLKYQSTRGQETKESFLCGATLINSRYVLTAAHCVANSTRYRLVGVRLGEHDLSTAEDCQDVVGTRECAPPPKDIDVETIIQHPNYNRTTSFNDIALIRLAAAADTTEDTIKPICLPVGLDAQDKDLDNQKLIVAGWGVLPETGLQSTSLRKVTIPVMPTEMCKTLYLTHRRQVTTNQLCAGGNNLAQDSCSGDGGGPLMTFGTVNGKRSMIQHGVVSYGPSGCGAQPLPSVFTRVGHYMEWILDNMKP